jgi:hypothetical protein
MSWTRAAMLGMSCVLCWLVGACGDSAPTAPGPDSGASPTPAAPAHVGFLHVHAGARLTTYQIHETGQLAMTADQPMPDVQQLRGDPEARFVFAAFGGSGGYYPPPVEPVLASYAPSPVDGSLLQLSAVSLGSYGTGIEWLWLDAGSERVFALWRDRWGHHWTDQYVTVGFANDGALGDVYSRTFPEDSSNSMVLDARSRMIYKIGSWNRGGLPREAVERGGQLTQTGWSDLCLAEATAQTPVGAVRGFLFAQGFSYRTWTSRLCTFEGPRLAPRASADLGPVDGLEVFDPSDRALPAWLVLPSATWTASGELSHSEIRLYALGSGGGLELRATAETADLVSQVVFHPSGRLLYAAVGTALWGFAVEPDGHLSKVVDVPGGAGRMVVTTPR